MTIVNGYDLLYLFFSLWALIAIVVSLRAFWLHLFGDKQIKIMHWPNSSSEACHYFTPRRTVEWFDFMGLVHTFKRVALSTETLSIIDKREVEAGFGFDRTTEVNEKQQDLWVDFMADTGDGISSTATVFSAVTREKLQIKDAGGKLLALPRGNLLIVGGDLVYPVASEGSYIDRFKGPMRLVFPFNGSADTETSPPRPFLLATPGNHDWYDGLTAFFRLVCQQKDIGNYKTVQNRSYFAYSLLPNVHVMGIDNQLMGDVDIPQINFFKKYATALKSDTLIQNIIIVVAEPYWYNFVAADAGKRRQRMDSLTYFIREITANISNLKIRMVVSGDMHHYSRYHNTDDSDVTDYVTSGGGGAFMHMTNFLRPTVELPCFKTAFGNSNAIPAGTTKKVFLQTTKYKREKTYPSFAQSAKHNRNNLLFAIHNTKFCVILLLLGFLSVYLYAPSHDSVVRTIGFITVPFFLIFIILKVQAPEQSEKEKKIANRWLVILALSTIFLNCFILKVIPNPPYISAFSAYRGNVDFFMTASFIAISQSILFGWYLYFSYRISKIHITEASSGFVNKGYKSFLRMHVTQTGIKVYVIGIKKAQNWWTMLKNKTSEEILQLQKDSATGKEDAVEKYFKNYEKDNLFLIETFRVSCK